jgi:AraC-like DNA-binding protein
MIEPLSAVSSSEFLGAATTRWASLFRTQVPERAADFVGRLYSPHALRVGRVDGFDMQLGGFEFGHFHVGAISYGSPVIAQLAPQQAHWVFSRLQRGTATRGRHGRTFGAGDASVLAPGETHEIHLSADMQLINLRIAHEDMIKACHALSGVEPGESLGFDDHLPAGSAATEVLHRITLLLANTPQYPQAAAACFERSLQEAVMFELLLAWPSAVSGYLAQPASLPETTRRARDYLHEHLEDLPTVGDLARHCGVSVRALAKGFARHLNTSPLQYMINLRLDRVCQQLQAHGREGNVTEVAHRWGFTHAGQFAARYRNRFGELPSDTQRKGRG